VPGDHFTFHPLSVETSSVKIILRRKALFPTPGKQGFTFDRLVLVQDYADDTDFTDFI